MMKIIQLLILKKVNLAQNNKIVKDIWLDQVFIAQWLARRLATGVVPDSNPCKGENLLISD